jgi:hypothetical protein
MGLPLIIGAAVVGGTINYFSADKEREDALRRAEVLTDEYRDLMIDSDERREMVDRIEDLYNTNMLSELNTASIPIAVTGAVNPGSVRSDIAGKVLGQRGKSILELEMEIERVNRDLQGEIAKVNAGVPSDEGSGIGDFFLGAAATTPIGIGISESIEANERNISLDEMLYGKAEDINEGVNNFKIPGDPYGLHDPLK